MRQGKRRISKRAFLSFSFPAPSVIFVLFSPGKLIKRDTCALLPAEFRLERGGGHISLSLLFPFPPISSRSRLTDWAKGKMLFFRVLANIKCHSGAESGPPLIVQLSGL